MNIGEITSIREILLALPEMPKNAWVYLPAGEDWDLESKGAVLYNEEVPPDRENDSDAGIPELAKIHKLVQALPITTMQEILSNARAQRDDLSVSDLLKAMIYYYNNDAFIILAAKR